MLTQGALAAATYSNLSGWDLPPNATPMMLSYLPLAHIFGVNPTPLHIGTKIHIPCIANARTQRHRHWWFDWLFQWFPLTPNRRPPSPQTQLTRRCSSSSQQDLPSSLGQPPGARPQRRFIPTWCCCQVGKTEANW